MANLMKNHGRVERQEKRNNTAAEKEIQQPATAEPCFDAHVLPDEILVHIFSFIADGRTLLDSVPLVCSRWRSVGRDPLAWAGVTLRCRDSADAARVLLHAPAVRSLHVDAAGGHADDEAVADARRRLASALRRTRAVVRRELRVTRSAWASLPGAGRLSAAELLWRQRRSLRRLDVFLDSGRPSLLTAIAQQQRLEVLNLDVGGDGVLYNGELADGDLALRELRVRADRHHYGTKEPNLPGALVLDLLRGAAATLRVLELDRRRDFPLDAIAQLQCVRDLALHCHLPGSWGDGDDDDEACEDVFAALQCCAKMDSPLQKLVVSLRRGKDTPFAFELDVWIGRLVDNFSARRPEVEVEFYTDGAPEDDSCWEKDPDESSDSSDSDDA